MKLKKNYSKFLLSFFTVIEVNRHRSISLWILSMKSDTHNYIMSLCGGKMRFTLTPLHATL